MPLLRQGIAMTEKGFIKVRFRQAGTANRPVIDIEGLVSNTELTVSPSTAYALRDALIAALDDYEMEVRK